MARITVPLTNTEIKSAKPIKLSPRITVWEEEKIEQWMRKKL